MKDSRALLLFLILLSTCLACGGGGGADFGLSVDAGVDGGAAADAGRETDAGPPDAGWTQPFAPAVCGMGAYSWLDPGTMGKVVKWEAVPEYSVDKKTIDDMLKSYNYDFLTAKYAVKLYRYRYETQDRGVKVEATGMLSIPDLETEDSFTTPYILWLHGTCGFSDACAASRLIDWILPTVLIGSQGFVGVAPDYIGQNGIGDPSTVKNPYMVGEATAIASLDALRAAPEMLRRVKSGITPDGRVVIWGGSQGGHATLFTELYAPYYAPGFDYIGAVSIIPPASLTRETEASISTYGGGSQYIAFFAVSFARWYGYEDRLAEVLQSGPPNDFANLLPRLMDTKCSNGINMGDYDVQGSTDLFAQGFVDKVTDGTWAEMDPWYCLMKENSLDGTSVARKGTTPFFFVTAEKDELVHTPVERGVFDALCERGYSMEYLECTDASHTEGGMWSLPEQFAWMRDRLDGRPLANPCVRGAPACCSATNQGPCAGE